MCLSRGAMGLSVIVAFHGYTHSLLALCIWETPTNSEDPAKLKRSL